MADVKVTGIEGTLKQAQESATTQRNALKGGNKKLGKIIALLIVAVALGLLWRDYRQEKRESAGKEIASNQESTPATVADAAMVENVVQLGLNQCSEPVAVKNGQCLLRREEVLERITFRTEVFNTSTQSWERLPAGGHRKAFWWRFCGVAEDAKAFYTIYPQPAGGCK